jgi:hypothetical protein
MKLQMIFLLMFGVLIVSSCTKEDPCTDCLGTFRCEINGEKWTPNCEGGGIVSGWCKDVTCEYTEKYHSLNLRVVNEDNNDRLRFSGRDVHLGINQVFFINREYIDYTRGNCGGYDLIQELPNYIEMTALDTINFTIEGTFAFSVLGTCDGDTLHITDGYFHLAYRF